MKGAVYQPLVLGLGTIMAVEGGVVPLSILMPGTGTWDFYKHAKFGHIELPPGRHRAVFQPDAKLTGFLIDLLEVRLVTTDADSPPEFPPLGEVVSKP